MCVSPRPLDGFQKGSLVQRSNFKKQLAYHNVSIERLCNATIVEVEGWKRLPTVRAEIRNENNFSDPNFFVKNSKVSSSADVV